MTLEDALKKLDALCDEYNIDEMGKGLFGAMIIPMKDKAAAVQIIENELKRRGPKE